MERYGVSIPFGVTAGGAPVSRLLLGGGGLACEVLSYGGTVRALRVPDRAGRPVDVVLGFDALADYEAQSQFIGATVGRYANRIGGARFSLGGEEFLLPANDGPNHLHGGPAGFDRRVWTVEELAADRAVLGLVSPGGEAGYPGTLRVKVTFALEDGGLSIRYEAVSDADTVCSLTNHSYFNLGGHDSGPVLDQEVMLCADRYTPTGGDSIPLGELEAVAGTPMDLRAMTPIGGRIDADFRQLRLAGGYDHNWAVRGVPGTLRPAARAFCPDTGIGLDVETTLPGVQFYTANHLAGLPAGKGGAVYGRRHAFCLETQFYPDAPNRPAFPSPVLRAGEKYDHTTRYVFWTEERA